MYSTVVVQGIAGASGMHPPGSGMPGGVPVPGVWTGEVFGGRVPLQLAPPQPRMEVQVVLTRITHSFEDIGGLMTGHAVGGAGGTDGVTQ